MKLPRLPRSFRIPAAVGFAVVAVGLTYPGGLVAAVEDFRDFRQHTRQMDDEREIAAALSGRVTSLSDRLLAKQTIVIELIDGRVKLGEATDRFLALTADDAVAMDYLRGKYDGSTDTERFARNVIDYAAAHVSPAESTALVAQLDGQFRTRYGHPR